MVLPALQPVGLYVRDAPVVVLPAPVVQRVQAQRRVALRARRVAGAAQHCGVVQICRVARVAAQWVPVERLAVRRLLARLHVVAALRVLRALWVVGAAPRCRVVQICRVARVAAQWVLRLGLAAERLAARRLLARLHVVAVLRAVQRVVHAAGCCHAVQTFRVHPLDWLRRLSAVVAWLVGLRLVSEPPL